MPKRFEDRDLEYAELYYRQFVASMRNDGTEIEETFEDLDSIEQSAIADAVEAVINKYIEEDL